MDCSRFIGTTSFVPDNDVGNGASLCVEKQQYILMVYFL